MRIPGGQEGEPSFDPDNMEKWMGPYIEVEEGGNYPSEVVTPVAHAVYDRPRRKGYQRRTVLVEFPSFQPVQVDRLPEGTMLVMAGAASDQAIEAAKARARETGMLPQVESAAAPALTPKALKPRPA